MNNTQRARLDSCRRVNDFCGEPANAPILGAIPDYLTEKGILDSEINKTEDAEQVQVSPYGGESSATLAAKTAMAAKVISLCLRGAYKARRAGNLTLAGALSIVSSDIMRAPKTKALAIAKGARKTMNDNLNILTNLSPAEITALDGKIDSYENLMDEPIEAIQTRKAVGTDQIEIHLRLAEEASDNILALAKSYLITSHPSLIDQLHLSSHIINTGTHHIDIEFRIADAVGNGIAGAEILDQSNQKRYSADQNGIIQIGSHYPGDFHFLVSATGKTDVDFSTHVHRGHNAFIVRMQ